MWPASFRWILLAFSGFISKKSILVGLNVGRSKRTNSNPLDTPRYPLQVSKVQVRVICVLKETVYADYVQTFLRTWQCIFKWFNCQLLYSKSSFIISSRVTTMFMTLWCCHMVSLPPQWWWNRCIEVPYALWKKSCWQKIG